VLGTHIEADDLRDEEVMAAYKAQSQVEGGFRFLQDPLFFVSSLFVKKPTRIQGLLMVMTLALLVYSVAQRRLRQELARQKESLPNQINQPTPRPTLRWVFQLLEGINRVRLIGQDQVYDLIEGLNEVQIKILRLVGQERAFDSLSKKMDIRSARGDHLSRWSVFETHPNGLALFSQVHRVEPLDHPCYQTLIGTR
jgi:hypothetical protein